MAEMAAKGNGKVCESLITYDTASPLKWCCKPEFCEFKKGCGYGAHCGSETIIKATVAAKK